MSTAEPIAHSPDDLLAMPDGKSCELVDGELVEKNMGAESEWIAGELYRILGNIISKPRLGWVWGSSTGYQCFDDAPGKVRKPDASYIRIGRLPGEQIPKGHIRIPPDIAVEVVSPNDLYYEVEAKVHEYLAAGTLLVWVINPETCTLQIYRQDGTTALLHESDTLSGEDVVPEFSCHVGDLFPPATTGN